MGQSITSVSAQIALTVPGIFDTPQLLTGWSADNIFETDQLEVTQTLMGLDGKQAGGYVYNPVNQTFTFQANAASAALFDQWAASQRQLQDALVATGNAALPSIGSRFIMSGGFLVMTSPIPVAGKVLQPRKFTVRWESVGRVPY